MSSGQSAQTQRRHVHFGDPHEVSLPRRVSSQIRYWWSRTPSESQHDNNGDVDPQQLEEGLGQQTIPELRTPGSENTGDSALEGTSWTSPEAEKVNDSANGHTFTSPNSCHEGDAYEKSEYSSHYYNTPSDTSKPPAQQPPEYTEEARTLVQSFTLGKNDTEFAEPRHGTQTPGIDQYIPDLDYVPAPENYKPSIFGAILTSRLHELQRESDQWRDQLATYTKPRKEVRRKPKHLRSRSYAPTASTSGTVTPSAKSRWYEKPERISSMANLLVQGGISSTSPGVPSTSGALPRRSISSHRSSGLVSTAIDMIRNGPQNGRGRSDRRLNRRKDIVAEVADILARRTYLIKLCDAFMRYGAPTHRVEEYLAASARALLIDAQFMYIPGAMMCTFIDNAIRANSVELVRRTEGLDFGRLKDVFNVYKLVIHEKYTVEEGILEIETIRKRPDPYGVWFRIFTFGMASVFCGPFSFNSRPIDAVPTFILGSAIGFLQLKVVPRSEQFSNVFEVFACVVAAFISRGLGSIRWSSGEYIFCFSATAQSSIAMILPGFLVLNSALELQGRSMVAGSVRMVYAIIYVLFLGFGLLVGTTIFGLIKRDATEDVTCQVSGWFSPVGNHWKLIYTRFMWAPLFACCVALIYRAKWRQLPVMALIAVCGHQANFWISTQLSSNLQVANAVGAFVIGCMANLYSRLFHGLAAASMLPAIYCQVPGGLAASGSLVAGINSSNQIFGNNSSVSVINNGTQGFVAAQNDPSAVYGGTIFYVGYGMVQVAIGISVGLYLSALVVYPYGKARSGLFSF